MKSILIPVKFELIKRPFDPDISYFAGLKSAENPRNLTPDVLKKFPGQSPMPRFHPFLDGENVVRISVKGALPNEHLSIMKDAFTRLLREKSLERDLVFRSKRRVEEVRQDDLDYQIRTSLSEFLKMQFLFELRAKEALLARNDFSDLLQETRAERIPKERVKIAARDETERIVRDRFDEAVLKGLEKVPREIIITGNSLRQILAEMSESESSLVMGAYARVQENILKVFADQLNDHIKNCVPNAVLFSISAEPRAHIALSGTMNQYVLNSLSYSHASTSLHDYNLMVENAEAAAADQLNDHANPETSNSIIYCPSIIDQEAIIETHKMEHQRNGLVQDKKVFLRVRRHEASGVAERQVADIAKRDTQIKSYWRGFDHANMTIRRSQMLHSTNFQSQANELSRQDPSMVQRVLRAVDDNQVTAHADTLMEPLDGNLPGAILFALSIFPDIYPKVNQILVAILDHQVEERKLDGSSLKAFNFFQDTRNTDRHDFYLAETELKSNAIGGRMKHEDALSQQSLRGVQGREMYWKIYDHLHKKSVPSLVDLVEDSQPLAKDLAKMPTMELQFVLEIIADKALRASDTEIIAAQEILQQAHSEGEKALQFSKDLELESAQRIEGPSTETISKKVS
jgi:hypothetical protein